MQIAQKMMLTLAAMAALTAAAQAEVKVSAPGVSKDIVVSQRADGLKAVLKPMKSSFAVNEEIKLFAQVNKQAYVYLFGVNRDGSGVLLFPNAHDKNNRLAPGRQAMIPSSAVFKSDAAGAEKVYMVASSTPLQLSPQKIAKGDFTAFERDAFASMFKDIKVEPRQGSTEERVMLELDIPVLGAAATQQVRPGAPAARQDVAQQAAPVVLVGTDKLTYKQGDQVVISFAADSNGVLELFTLDENENVQSLGEFTVLKDKMYKKKAVATPPTGKQYLVAVYKGQEASQAKSFNASGKNFKPFAKSVVKPSAAKGLVLAEEKQEEPAAFAAYQFEVR